VVVAVAHLLLVEMEAVEQEETAALEQHPLLAELL
jgi:hypothetical protein